MTRTESHRVRHFPVPCLGGGPTRQRTGCEASEGARLAAEQARSERRRVQISFADDKNGARRLRKTGHVGREIFAESMKLRQLGPRTCLGHHSDPRDSEECVVLGAKEKQPRKLLRCEGGSEGGGSFAVPPSHQPFATRNHPRQHADIAYVALDASRRASQRDVRHLRKVS